VVRQSVLRLPARRTGLVLRIPQLESAPVNVKRSALAPVPVFWSLPPVTSRRQRARLILEAAGQPPARPSFPRGHVPDPRFRRLHEPAHSHERRVPLPSPLRSSSSSMTSTMASGVSALVCHIRRSELHYGATRSTRKVLPYAGEARLEQFLNLTPSHSDLGRAEGGRRLLVSSQTRG
jgi:hypothetical protein